MNKEVYSRLSYYRIITMRPIHGLKDKSLHRVRTGTLKIYQPVSNFKNRLML